MQKAEVVKRIRTTMIGSIAAIENHFSFLWEKDNLLKEKFNNLRKEILDLGNKQIRNFLEDEGNEESS